MLRREHASSFFSNLVQRFGECASFKLTDKDNSDVIPATLEMNGEAETATFLYRGYEYSLRAVRFIPKAYSLNIDGRLEKMMISSRTLISTRRKIAAR